jgi:hypothetical protein
MSFGHRFAMVARRVANLANLGLATFAAGAGHDMPRLIRFNHQFFWVFIAFGKLTGLAMEMAHL